MITQEFLERIMSRKESEFPRGTPQNPHLVRAQPEQNTLSLTFKHPLMDIRPFGVSPFVRMFVHSPVVAFQFSAIDAEVTDDDIVFSPQMQLFNDMETDCVLLIQELEKVIDAVTYHFGILAFSGGLVSPESLMPKEST